MVAGARGKVAKATNVHMVNGRGGTICAKYWVPNEVGGGCRELGSGQAWDLGLTPRWRAATIWAMPGGCAGQPCNTGPPTGVTQFEITVAGGWNNDYYDISTLAGFNLGMRVSPTNANCPSQDCPAPGSRCQGFVPSGPDRTAACRYGSTDYVILFSG